MDTYLLRVPLLIPGTPSASGSERALSAPECAKGGSDSFVGMNAPIVPYSGPCPKTSYAQLALQPVDDADPMASFGHLLIADASTASAAAARI